MSFKFRLPLIDYCNNLGDFGSIIGLFKVFYFWNLTKIRYGKTKHSKLRNSNSPKRNNNKVSVSVEIYPLPNRLCQFSVVPRNKWRYEFFRLAITDHLQNHMIVLSTPLTLNNERLLPPDCTGSKGLIKLERLRDTYFFVSRTGHPLDVKTLMNALKHLHQILQNATGLIERKTMNYRQPTWVQLLADLLSCSIRNCIYYRD